MIETLTKVMTDYAPVLAAALFLAVWLALQLWILPMFGVKT